MDSVSRQYPQRNLHGRIVHTLGRRILRGEINPGDALEAGSVMAASRTALREAIRVLAAKGLVVARPKIGTRVTPRESWNLLDPDVMAWQHGAAPAGVPAEDHRSARRHRTPGGGICGRTGG